MIRMHSKYDNMHMNGIFYALICINNHVITSISYMLLHTQCLLDACMGLACIHVMLTQHLKGTIIKDF